MDIQLPTGEILTGVPDGTTKSQLVAKLYQKGISVPEEWLPEKQRGWSQFLDSHGFQKISPLYTPEFAEKARVQIEKDAKEYAPTGTNAQNFMAGAGKSVVDLGRGLKQIGAEAGNAAGIVPDQTVANVQSDIDAAKLRDAALMETKAGLGGDIAGTLATTLIPGGAIAKGAEALGLAKTALTARAFVNPRTLLASLGVGGAQGALQPVASDESRLANTAVGAAGGGLGSAVAKVSSAVAQPVKNVLSATAQKAVNVLESAGVPLDLAQRTGSKVANRAKLVLADNPIVGDGGFAERQQAAYNKAVLATAGETAEAATPDVMARAQQRIGGVMNDIAQRNPIKYDGQLQTQLAQVVKDANLELQDSQKGVIRNQVEEILNKAVQGNGAIDGAAYQNTKTMLDRISMGQDQSIAHYARQLREVLDSALQRSASGTDYQALKVARQQYRALKQIEPAIAADSSGNISAAKLANSLGTKRNAAQSKYGKGNQDLVKLAKAGKEILPQRMPNSGTTARAAAQLLAPGLIAGGANFASTGDPSEALKMAAAGVVAPRIARSVLQNPRISGYLANGLGNPTLRGLLMAPQTHALIGAPLKQGAIIPGLGLLNAPQ
jgi:hypothetical protein